MSDIEIFQEEVPTLESYWRSIILFGRNVASYKFALAKSLLEILPSGKTDITLDELAEPYARHICEHLKSAPRQSTSNTSQFLKACRMFNEQAISSEQLRDITVQKGFVHVLDAFHNVNGEEIPVRFFEKDYSARNNKKIILCDDVFKLKEIPFAENLAAEAESRWNLVETAWELGVSRNLLDVKYDADKKLFVVDETFRRKEVTSARSALNGYQKSKCFYCFDDIKVDEGGENTCDVDHFFPHVLKPFLPKVNLDGVWNLVLTCQRCNRGEAGKFAQVPAVEYLRRLHKRNEFLISSHHPLREIIIRQTGNTREKRQEFLRNMDRQAINLLLHRWETVQVGPAIF